MSNYFKRGFNSVYFPRVHCPVCKEEIYANALVCPKCKTDFTQPPYYRRTNWQKIPMRIILIFAVLIAISISLSGVPIILGVIIGFVLYGIGYLILIKIQSWKNYFHK